MTDPGATPAAEKLAGALLVCVATAVISLVEVFLVVLRVGTTRAPVSFAMAVILHPLLTRWMRDATGSRRAALVPFVVWLAVVLPLGSSRSEGDLVLTGQWVSYAYLVVAMAAFAVAIGLLRPSGRSAG